MRINAIKTDKDGCKLIAASNVINFKGCKPQESPCVFFDYKDGLLREFSGNNYVSVSLPTFKLALKYLFNK